MKMSPPFASQGPGRFIDSVPIGASIWAIVIFELSLGVSAWMVGYWTGYPPLQDFAWTWEAGIWGVLATLPTLVALAWMTTTSFAPVRNMVRTVEEWSKDVLLDAPWVVLLLIGLAAGIGEEMLFRGLIQQALMDHIGVAWGLILASIGFGLAHAMSWTYFWFATLFGLYLGGFWIATDNLLVPIIVHAAYDVIALWALAWRARRGQRNPEFPLGDSDWDPDPGTES